MKKEILMISLFFVLSLVVSGCAKYPITYSKNVENTGGEVEETSGLLRNTDSGPFKCMYGLTCKKPNGVQYSVPCERDLSTNSCIQRECDQGDRWVSGYCKRVTLSSDSEISN